MIGHPNLKGLWRGQQSPNDDSGNSRNGSWSASGAYAASVIGDGFKFNGSNYIILDPHAGALCTPTQGTIMIAANIPSSNCCLLSVHKTGLNGYVGIFVFADGTVHFVSTSADASAYLLLWATPAVFQFGADNIIVFRGGASDNACFVNGIKQTLTYTYGGSTTNAWFSLHGNSTDKCNFGRRSLYADYFIPNNGNVSQIGWFDKSLPDSDCRRLSVDLHPLTRS